MAMALRPELPALEVDLLDVLDGRRLGHVDGLADGARDERLDRGHHPDVAHVVDGALAVDRLEGAVEDREVLRLEARRALDRLAIVDVLDDLLDLLGRIAELLERARHGLVDDLEEALADELLVLDERDVRLDAGRVAIHQEGDGAGRGKDADLRVAEAVLPAELERLVPGVARPRSNKVGGRLALGDLIRSVTMLCR